MAQHTLGGKAVTIPELVSNPNALSLRLASYWHWTPRGTHRHLTRVTSSETFTSNKCKKEGCWLIFVKKLTKDVKKAWALEGQILTYFLQINFVCVLWPPSKVVTHFSAFDCDCGVLIYIKKKKPEILNVLWTHVCAYLEQLDGSRTYKTSMGKILILRCMLLIQKSCAVHFCDVVVCGPAFLCEFSNKVTNFVIMRENRTTKYIFFPWLVSNHYRNVSI